MPEPTIGNTVSTMGRGSSPALLFSISVHPCSEAVPVLQNPRRAPQARHRRGRAHRLPPDAEAPHTALADLAHILDQSPPEPGRPRFLHGPTLRLRVLFILVVLAHHRRRVLHFNVTENPTAAWTAQQVVDAFPDDSAPSYLLRDRDSIYGPAFRKRVKGMGISEVPTAPHSPWQNPCAERLIGSIRS